MRKGAVFNYFSLILYSCLRGTNEIMYDNRLEGRHFIGGISTKLDHVLIGQNMSSFQTRGMIECAQKCLSMNLQCGSMNYQIKKRWCELNKLATEQSMNNVVYRKGFVFVLLFWKVWKTKQVFSHCQKLVIVYKWIAKNFPSAPAISKGDMHVSFYK